MKSEKIDNNAISDPNEKRERITRKVAIAFAFVSVFYFFIKLLFL